MHHFYLQSLYFVNNTKQLWRHHAVVHAVEPCDWLQDLTWPADCSQGIDVNINIRDVYERLSEGCEREPSMNFRSENEQAVCVMHIVNLSILCRLLWVIITEFNERFTEGSRTSQTSNGRAMDVCRSSRSSVPGGGAVVFDVSYHC